jgi:hypothetical protein
VMETRESRGQQKSSQTLVCFVSGIVYLNQSFAPRFVFSCFFQRWRRNHNGNLRLQYVDIFVGSFYAVELC